MMARQKSGLSMLSCQRMLGIKTVQDCWAMGHKIRKAMADRDSQYQLAGLVEMDDAFIGPKKPGPRGRGESQGSDFRRKPRQTRGIRRDAACSGR